MAVAWLFSDGGALFTPSLVGDFNGILGVNVAYLDGLGAEPKVDADYVAPFVFANAQQKPCFPLPHDPQDTDFYYAVIATTFLGTDTLVSVSATMPSGSGLSVSDFQIADNVVRMTISGGNEGEWLIPILFTTSLGRVRERSAYLTVRHQ